MSRSKIDPARHFTDLLIAADEARRARAASVGQVLADLLRVYDLADLGAALRLAPGDEHSPVLALGLFALDAAADTEVGATPGSGAVIRFQPVTGLHRFAVNPSGVAAMIAALGEDLPDLLPSKGDEQPAEMLFRLFERAYTTEQARCYGSDAPGFDAVVGDPRLELELITDDNPEISGIHILIKELEPGTTAEESSPIRLTDGWTEVSVVNPEAPDFDPARELEALLTEICAHANTVLAALVDGSRRPRTAELRRRRSRALTAGEIGEAAAIDDQLIARGWHTSVRHTPASGTARSTT